MNPYLIGAAGTALGAVGKFAYDKYTENDSQPKSVLSKEMKNIEEVKCSVMGLAASANGVIKPQEKDSFQSHLGDLSNVYEVEDETLNRLSDLFENAIGLKQLAAKCNSIELSDELKEEILLSYDEISKSDGQVDDIELALRFQISLVLNNFEDVQLVKLNSSGEEIKHIAYTEMGVVNAKNQYPKTLEQYLSSDTKFLIPHPADKLQLVPFEYLLSEDFANSKESEFIEAARLAGAKRIKVFNLSSKTFSEKDNKSAQVNVEKSGVDVGGSASKNQNNSNESYLQAHQEYEFQGYQHALRTKFLSLFQDLSRGVLERSTYLKQDDKMVSFVNSCYCFNRIKKFQLEIKSKEIADSIETAKLALDSKMFKSCAQVKANVETDIQTIREQVKRYEVEF